MITIRGLDKLPLEGNIKNMGKEQKRQRNNSPKTGSRQHPHASQNSNDRQRESLGRMEYPPGQISAEE